MKIIKIIAILLIINLLPLTFSLCSIGGNKSDETEGDGSDDSSEGEDIDYYAESAILKGSLSIEEINKIVPPTSPLPNDITFESIITRSDLLTREDIIQRSDFVFKLELPDSTSVELEDDQTFNLPVPVGFEFISLVKIDGDIVGLIKFKKGEKYVANVTLSNETLSQYKEMKSVTSTEYIIGNITWSDDFFIAENSLFDVADTVATEEELDVGTDTSDDSDVQKITMVAEEEKNLNIKVESEEKISFGMINLPEFCTFTDNADNSAEIVCTPTIDNVGTHRGIYLSAVTETKKGSLELAFIVYQYIKGSLSSIHAGESHTCAILDGGILKCWGKNDYGQLGLGNTNTIGDETEEMGSNLSVVDIETGKKATSICSDNSTTYALRDDGSLVFWGKPYYSNNIDYNIGNEPEEMGDYLQVVPLGTGKKVTTLSCGSGFACAILDDGLVKCWGFSSIDEMGDNLLALDLGAGRKAISITSSSVHTCAILDNKSVKCWGSNGFGQLGIGDTKARGDEPNEMGDNLPAVDLGTGRYATSISANGNSLSAHTCALLDNNSIKCWGSSDGGLGVGGTRGDSASDMGDNLPSVSLGSGRSAIVISAGFDHNCVILDDKSIKCWGKNDFGQLGIENKSSAGFEEYYAPDNMGESKGAVPLGAGRSAVAISAGNKYTCVILDNGSAKCWGKNDFGQLGLGHTNTIGDEIDEMGDKLPAIDLGILSID